VGDFVEIFIHYNKDLLKGKTFCHSYNRRQIHFASGSLDRWFRLGFPVRGLKKTEHCDIVSKKFFNFNDVRTD